MVRFQYSINMFIDGFFGLLLGSIFYEYTISQLCRVCISLVLKI